jgi:hypothetical protein
LLTGRAFGFVAGSFSSISQQQEIYVSEVFRMTRTPFFFAALLLGGVMLPAFSPLLAQETAASEASTIVTVEPKGSGELAEPVTASAVKVKVNGKDAKVADWHGFTTNGTQPNL